MTASKAGVTTVRRLEVARSARSGRRSFTLIEMVVAVGIIVLLAALTVYATVALVERSEVSRTENTLRLLDLAVTEWQAAADRRVSWGVDDLPPGATYDMRNDTPHVFTISELLRVLRRSEAVKPILAQIDPKNVYTYDMNNPVSPEWLPAVPDPDDPDPSIAGGAPDPAPWDGELAVLDAWGKPIRVVHAGARGVGDYTGPSVETNDDGTILVDRSALDDGTALYGVESIYGECEGRRIRFVSAGPDGKFGDLEVEETEPLHLQAEDNVHSYAVSDEHGP